MPEEEKSLVELEKLRLEAKKLQMEVDAKTRESEKLDLEIKALRQPWWQMPAYVAALLPTLLAIASLIYAFRNGYFQVAALQQKIADDRQKIERTQLEMQNGDLKKEREGLQQEVADFTQKKDQLHQLNDSLSAKNQTLATANDDSKKRLDVLNGQVAGLQTQRSQLSGQLDRLKQQNHDVEQRSAELQKNLEIAPAEMFVSSVAKAQWVYPGNDDALLFLKQSRDHPDSRKAWREVLVRALNGTKDTPHRVAILYVLYFMTRERPWRDELVSDIKAAAYQGNTSDAHAVIAAINDYRVDMDAGGGWTRDDKCDFIRLTAGMLRDPKVTEESRENLMNALSFIRFGDGLRIYDTVPHEYLDLIRVARDTALKNNPGRTTGLRLLKALSPWTCLAVAAAILTDPTTSATDRVYVAQDTRYLSPITQGYGPLPSGHPESADVAEWTKWKNAHADLAVWLDPKLDQFDADKSLFIAAIEHETAVGGAQPSGAGGRPES